jgi:hypothetical protein
MTSQARGISMPEPAVTQKNLQPDNVVFSDLHLRVCNRRLEIISGLQGVQVLLFDQAGLTNKNCLVFTILNWTSAVAPIR